MIPIAIWAGYLRWRRPNWQVLIVPILAFGGVLAFQAYSYASGQTFGFLRFYIVAVPFAACLAMLAVPDGELVQPTRRGRHAPAQTAGLSTRPARFAYVAVAVVFAICVPVGGWGMMVMVAIVWVSGIFSPLATMATWVQILGQLTPTYWLGLGLRSTLLPEAAVVVEIDGSWRTLLTIAVLAAWAIAGMILAPVLLRRMARRESGSSVAARREKALQRV